MAGLRIHRDKAFRWTNLGERATQRLAAVAPSAGGMGAVSGGPGALDNGHRSSTTPPGRGLFVPSSAISRSSTGSLYAVHSMIPTASGNGVLAGMVFSSLPRNEEHLAGNGWWMQYLRRVWA